MNWDETGGWIFSDDGYAWMTEKSVFRQDMRYMFAIKKDAEDDRWLESVHAWSVPARWPSPFNPHRLRISFA